MVLAVLREAEDWIAAGFAPIGAAYAAWSQIQFVMKRSLPKSSS
jgi:hypothetical protein